MTLVPAALCLLALAPAASGDPEGRDEVHAWYGLGATFDGRVTGSCDASGLFLQRDHAGSLRFRSDGGNLLEHDVEVNETRVAPPAGPPASLIAAGHINVLNHPAPAGWGTAYWGTTGRLSAYAPPGPLYHPDRVATFHVGFDVAQATTGVLLGTLPTVPYFEENTPNLLASGTSYLPGYQRIVTLANGSLEARGDIVVALEGASIAFDDGTTLRLPDRYENLTRLGPPSAAEVSIHRVHYGFLTLRNASLELPVDGTQVACRSSQLALDGSARLGLARGTLERPGTNISFHEQELGLTGRLTWRETLGEGGVHAEGSGAIQSATVDFVRVAGGHGVPLATIGLWALIVATLGAVAYAAAKACLGFFSRLTETRLVQHPGRALVLQTVKSNPNVTLHSLAATTGLHKSVVRYHARILEAKGLLRSHRVLQDRCFVAKETLKHEGRAVLAPSMDLVLKNDAALAEITRSVPIGGIRLHELVEILSQKLGVTKPGAWKAVMRAQGRGLVTRVRVGREVWIQCV